MSLSNSSALIEKEFEALGQVSYFNTAYFGPLPKRSKELINKKLERISCPTFVPYDEWVNIPEFMRVKIAELLGCPSENITHSTSVTDVITQIATSLNLKSGEQVVSIDGDYPSNVRAWRYAAEANKAIGQIKHTLLKDAPLDLGVDWLKVNLPKDTKVLNLSHVAFNTGRKVDLLQIGKFLKTRDILFIVDGTQAFGGIYYTKEELNLIDCLVCSTYKWLLGPYGSSFAYYSNRLLAQMNILQGSWLTSIGFTKRRQIIDYSLDPLSGARPYDRGQAPNLLNTAGLEGSLSLFSELGLKSIYEHNQKLTHFFVENLKAKNLNIVAPKSCLSNIICLKSLTDTEQLQAKLQKNNIDISIRDGNLRISFHLFNHMTQVESLLSVLNQ